MGNDVRPAVPARYAVAVRLGTGGMASIWAADDTLLGRRVAIKILAENFAQQERFVRRFEREARTAASLSGHPNVITTYDVGECEGRPFIVMECLSGGTVADRLRANRPIPRGQALDWLRQIASALDFAHERGVVHRDVKPQNLLFDDRGRLVIADFGIARAAYEGALTSSGELIGTAGYISPEHARGDSGTAASDRYSLAVLAFELLTGERPFAGGDFAEEAHRHVSAEPPAASGVAPGLPHAVDPILRRGMAKDPAARWPSASAFVEALAGALDEPERAAGLEPERTAVTPGRRRLVPVAAVAVAAIAAGAIVGSALLDNGATPSQQQPHRSPKKQSRPASTRASAAAGPVTASQAAALNDQGFQLMNARRYAEAIPPLQRAVAGFGKGSSDLTYAYALYNLGRSLRLAGRPREAIPLLERRLRFANQRETVQRELDAARRAAAR